MMEDFVAQTVIEQHQEDVMEEIKNLEERIEVLEVDVNNAMYNFIEHWSLQK